MFELSFVLSLLTYCFSFNTFYLYIFTFCKVNGKLSHAKASQWASTLVSCFSKLTTGPKSPNWEAAARATGCRGNKRLDWSVSGWQNKQITVNHCSTVVPLKTSRPGSEDACFHFLEGRVWALYLRDFTSCFFFFIIHCLEFVLDP